MEDHLDDEQLDHQRSSRDEGARSSQDHQDEEHADADGSSRDDRSNPAGDDQAPGDRDDLLANLTTRQQKAILALVTEPTLAQAAKSAEVGERTLRRWLSQPDFSRAYRGARRESFSQALALALRYTPLAINTLGKLASDSMTPPSSRVSACNGILKFARDSIELDDLQARIEALESAAAQQERWKSR